MKPICTLLALALALSGCITQRRATFSTAPGPLPLTPELQTRPLERTWALGEIFVTAEDQSMQQTANDWSKARAQIEERLAATIKAQTSLGFRTDDRQSAELIVDVDVRIHEVRGMNAWIVPAILSELAILGLGAGTGAGIGAALGRNNPNSEGAAIGSLVGSAIAIAPAVLVPLLFPTTDVVGGADAKLTFRRASDGVVIYEKKTRSEWVAKHNSYWEEEKLAQITGAGAEALEKQLVITLYAGLKASPAALVSAEHPSAEPTVLLSDAPKRMVLPR